MSEESWWLKRAQKRYIYDEVNMIKKYNEHQFDESRINSCFIIFEKERIKARVLKQFQDAQSTFSRKNRFTNWLKGKLDLSTNMFEYGELTPAQKKKIFVKENLPIEVR